MIFSTKWLQIKIIDKGKMHYTLIGFFSKYWSAGIVGWDKDRPYTWR